LLVGANTATGLKAGFSYDNREVGMKYTYDALQGTFSFSTNAAGVVTSGTTYLLPADSGGPTFESNGMGGLALVGVHSTSQRSVVNGTVIPYNFPGQMWADVNVSQYTNWITDAEKAANVCPEPSTWAMMLIGLAGLGVAGYRKAKCEASGHSA